MPWLQPLFGARAEQKQSSHKYINIYNKKIDCVILKIYQLVYIVWLEDPKCTDIVIFKKLKTAQFGFIWCRCGSLLIGSKNVVTVGIREDRRHNV